MIENCGKNDKPVARKSKVTDKRSDAFIPIRKWVSFLKLMADRCQYLMERVLTQAMILLKLFGTFSI